MDGRDGMGWKSLGGAMLRAPLVQISRKEEIEYAMGEYNVENKIHTKAWNAFNSVICNSSS